MQTFVGTKIVRATPMSLLHYHNLRSLPITKDTDATALGYLVEYLDGGEPNHPNFSGYISWCPKEQFEAQNQEITLGDIPLELFAPHELRVVVELTQLTQRLAALEAFIAKGKPDYIDEDEWNRLGNQADAMTTYQGILHDRIEAFPCIIALQAEHDAAEEVAPLTPPEDPEMNDEPKSGIVYTEEDAAAQAGLNPATPAVTPAPLVDATGDLNQQQETQVEPVQQEQQQSETQTEDTNTEKAPDSSEQGDTQLQDENQA